MPDHKNDEVVDMDLETEKQLQEDEDDAHAKKDELHPELEDAKIKEEDKEPNEQ